MFYKKNFKFCQEFCFYAIFDIKKKSSSEQNPILVTEADCTQKKNKRRQVHAEFDEANQE